MATPVQRLGVPALFAAAAASCVSFTPARTVTQDALFLEDRGEVVFDQYLIPVSERGTDFRVRSGPFRADELWGAGEVAERVHCGPDDVGNSLMRGAPVLLSVELRLSDRPYGTRLSIDSRGHTVKEAEHERTAECRLKEPFVEELLTAIAGARDVDVLGQPNPGDPTPPLGPRLPGDPPR